MDNKEDPVPDEIQHAFAVLNLSPSASAADVKRAYRKFSLALHPDRNPENLPHEHFAKLNSAYAMATEFISRKDSQRISTTEPADDTAAEEETAEVSCPASSLIVPPPYVAMKDSVQFVDETPSTTIDGPLLFGLLDSIELSTGLQAAGARRSKTTPRLPNAIVKAKTQDIKLAKSANKVDFELHLHSESWFQTESTVTVSAQTPVNPRDIISASLDVQPSEFDADVGMHSIFDAVDVSYERKLDFAARRSRPTLRSVWPYLAGGRPESEHIPYHAPEETKRAENGESPEVVLVPDSNQDVHFQGLVDGVPAATLSAGYDASEGLSIASQFRYNAPLRLHMPIQCRWGPFAERMRRSTAIDEQDPQYPAAAGPGWEAVCPLLFPSTKRVVLADSHHTSTPRRDRTGTQSYTRQETVQRLPFLEVRRLVPDLTHLTPELIHQYRTATQAANPANTPHDADQARLKAATVAFGKAAVQAAWGEGDPATESMGTLVRAGYGQALVPVQPRKGLKARGWWGLPGYTTASFWLSKLSHAVAATVPWAPVFPVTVSAGLTGKYSVGTDSVMRAVQTITGIELLEDDEDFELEEYDEEDEEGGESWDDDEWADEASIERTLAAAEKKKQATSALSSVRPPDLESHDIRRTIDSFPLPLVDDLAAPPDIDWMYGTSAVGLDLQYSAALLSLSYWRYQAVARTALEHVSTVRVKLLQAIAESAKGLDQDVDLEESDDEEEEVLGGTENGMDETGDGDKTLSAVEKELAELAATRHEGRSGPRTPGSPPDAARDEAEETLGLWSLEEERAWEGWEMLAALHRETVDPARQGHTLLDPAVREASALAGAYIRSPRKLSPAAIAELKRRVNRCRIALAELAARLDRKKPAISLSLSGNTAVSDVYNAAVVLKEYRRTGSLASIVDAPDSGVDLTGRAAVAFQWSPSGRTVLNTTISNQGTKLLMITRYVMHTDPLRVLRR